MLDSIFSTVITNGITPGAFAACTLVSLLAGPALSLSHMFKNSCSKSFAVAVALLPFTVQEVIMLVNGNLGTGVAVAGAFSLVRFCSSPGSAKEIIGVFTAMAAGLACGVGYIGVAIIFVALICGANIIYTLSRFGEQPDNVRELKVTIPEDLNFTGVFDDIFEKLTVSHKLRCVKTSNKGSLYRLTYALELKKPECEKELINEMQCRNGNLDIVSNCRATVTEEL